MKNTIEENDMEILKNIQKNDHPENNKILKKNYPNLDSNLKLTPSLKMSDLQTDRKFVKLEPQPLKEKGKISAQARAKKRLLNKQRYEQQQALKREQEPEKLPIKQPIKQPIKRPIKRQVPVKEVVKTPIQKEIEIIEPKKEIKELILGDWQIEWAQKAFNILQKNPGFIDTSKMGSGKTYVTLWLALQYSCKLFIICPVTVIDVWKSTAEEYGVEIAFITSYESLRSKRGSQPRHPYLERQDVLTEGGKNIVSFEATQLYIDLLDDGLIVVLDEIQKIKNKSAQYKACEALLSPITPGDTHSRFALLSGTPIDKEEHAINLLKLLGYIKSTRLYTYMEKTERLIYEGLQELIDECVKIDAEETERVLQEEEISRNNLEHICYVLYVKVIKPAISGAMPPPTNIKGDFDVKNGYYNISKKNVNKLATAIENLSSAIEYNDLNYKNGEDSISISTSTSSNFAQDSLGKRKKALVNIENAKADDIARVMKAKLLKNPQQKGIISVNYTSTIRDLEYLLRDFNPLILNGQVKKINRGEIVRNFNTNPHYRVLIMNTVVGGVGISLHDIIGDAPRFMIISPDDRFLDVIQAVYRIYRPGTMSNAEVRIFYGKTEFGDETAILDKMVTHNVMESEKKKTKVLKGTLETSVLDTLILPGDYESEIEG